MSEGQSEEMDESRPQDDPARPTVEWSWEPGGSQGATPPGGEPPRRGRVVLAAVLAGLVLLFAGIGIGWTFSRGGVSGAVSTSEAPLTPAPQLTPSQGQTGSGDEVSSIADRVDDAVVDVNTVLDEDPFDNTPAEATGAGTGMVLTPSGLVLTLSLIHI